MENIESDITKLREAILNYLQHNPNAVDSLEGITNWWLPQAYKKEGVSRIEKILEQLIEEGSVKKASLIDGTIVYMKGKSVDQ